MRRSNQDWEMSQFSDEIDVEFQKWTAMMLDKKDAEITRLRADLAAVKEERDDLRACLAPVEDEELVEIAAYYFTDGSSWSALSERLRNICRRDARNVIADIRPHIEAAERERCAKVAEGFSSNRDWVPGSLWGNIRNEIAAAIRSGK